MHLHTLVISIYQLLIFFTVNSIQIYEVIMPWISIFNTTSLFAPKFILPDFELSLHMCDKQIVFQYSLPLFSLWGAKFSLLIEQHMLIQLIVFQQKQSSQLGKPLEKSCEIKVFRPINQMLLHFCGTNIPILQTTLVL